MKEQSFHSFKMFILLLFIVTVRAFNARKSTNLLAVSIKKAELLEVIDGRRSDIYVCPETLEPLKEKTRFIGCFSESYFSSDANVKYRSSKVGQNGLFLDLTSPSTLRKPMWQQSRKEVVNTNFFKIPFISAIYERGYRQNFERAGFPGIEKEFVEVQELFNAANASLVLDLSCGSGFMTRKLLKSKQ